RQLAELAVLELDRADQVLLAERALLLRGEEGGAQRAVADVAARQREAARQIDEVEVADHRRLGRHVRAPQADADLLVGEREVEAQGHAALEGLIDRALE